MKMMGTARLAIVMAGFRRRSVGIAASPAIGLCAGNLREVGMDQIVGDVSQEKNCDQACGRCQPATRRSVSTPIHHGSLLSGLSAVNAGMC